MNSEPKWICPFCGRQFSEDDIEGKDLLPICNKCGEDLIEKEAHKS